MSEKEMNIENNMRYDAFISYRHCDPDSFVAENIHKQLETFKLPGNLRKQILSKNSDAKVTINRVFRDKEELPLANNLEDPIVEALKSSEWLIVICSPRLKESMWCKKEIETFIELNGSEHVLAVLVEGEPSDSFPTELLSRKIKTVDANGNEIVTEEPIEPLAADVRADNDKDRLKAIKEEVLRLLAPIFGLEYAELKQRHRERKIRRLIGLVAIIAIICFAFGVLGTTSAIIINGQKNKISEQSEELMENALELAEQADMILEQNETLLTNQAINLANDSISLYDQDDRLGALALAYQSLTSYEGIDMPYTSRGMCALVKSLRPYTIVSSYRPTTEIVTKGAVEDIFVSKDMDIAAICDSTGTITFWSDTEEKVVGSIIVPNLECSEKTMGFVDSDRFLYCVDNIAYVYSISKDESTVMHAFSDFSYIYKVSFDFNSEIIYVVAGNEISGYDMNSYESTGFQYGSREETVNDGSRAYSNSYVGIVFSRGENASNNSYIKVVDKNGDTVMEPASLDGAYFNSNIYDGNLYVITHKYVEVEGILVNRETILTAYSLETGKELWKNDEIGQTHEKVAVLYDEEDNPYIMLIGERGIRDINIETGETQNLKNFDTRILWSAGSSSLLYVFSENYGVATYFDHMDMGTMIDISYNLYDIANFERTINSFLMSADNSNHVIVYIDEEMSEYEEVENQYNDEPAISYLGENTDYSNSDLPESAMVRYAIYDEDKNYICVTTKDRKAVVYDADSMEEVARWDIEGNYEDINQYLGTDDDGNTYWASSHNGYCISPENELIMEIPYLRAIDTKKNCYIIGGLFSDERYAVEIYDKDELLDMAVEELERFDAMPE